MLGKQSGQKGFGDLEASSRLSDSHFLRQIDRQIDWRPFEKLLEPLYHPTQGRPSHPPVVMFKALLLQQWYSLSDPGLEEAIADRLSFRKFCGLKLEDKVPDHSTIHRFRDRIAPIMPKLFSEINRQLDKNGMLLRKGTLVDATLIQAAGRPGSDNNNKTPSDPDARWGGKSEKPVYGYKGHIGLDQDSELIRKAELTPANEHDSKQFKSMVSGDEFAAYADKAYTSKEHSDWLQEQGVEDCILFKAAPGRPLTRSQRSINRELTAIRRNVEHVFGTFKRLYRWRRCRHYSLVRNRSSFLVLCMAYNLKRTIKLKSA